MPNFGVADTYEYAGVTFASDQVPLLLESDGDPTDFSVSVDVANSTAEWRWASLQPLAVATCRATGTDGTYSMNLEVSQKDGSQPFSLLVARVEVSTRVSEQKGRKGSLF